MNTSLPKGGRGHKACEEWGAGGSSETVPVAAAPSLCR